MRNFTLNLNFQNSHMLFSYFGINVSENLIVSSNYFRPKSLLEFRESLHSQRHAKKFFPSSVSNRFLYRKTLVIYFESYRESELVDSMLFKGNLSLNLLTKKLNLNHFLGP